ncbi:NAC domain-containing protein 83-like [Actinidia eriantha]|uniref:NAC domain-containing protein 83-like n=1 Tax=Actinidia eriantha TaxID=165200 RepID=UPI00258BD2EB|nr:NAC domain-containing protein 83-like [Actinidia eriantha]
MAVRRHDSGGGDVCLLAMRLERDRENQFPWLMAVRCDSGSGYVWRIRYVEGPRRTGLFSITDHGGRVIGFKKKLVYKSKGTNGRWLMKEYHLDGVSLESQPKFNDYVLCAIRKKYDGRKQEKQNDDLGNQDGEGFGSDNCAEYSIIERKHPRIEYVEKEKVEYLILDDELDQPNVTQDHCDNGIRTPGSGLSDQSQDFYSEEIFSLLADG